MEAVAHTALMQLSRGDFDSVRSDVRHSEAMRVAVTVLAALVLASTASAHAGDKNLWTHKKLMDTAVSAIVRVDGTMYIVLPEKCIGEGRGVLRRGKHGVGKRAWRHFRCTGQAMRESFRSDIRFRIHVIRNGSTFATSDGKLVK
jgi:hypothetical protein